MRVIVRGSVFRRPFLSVCSQTPQVPPTRCSSSSGDETVAGLASDIVNGPGGHLFEDLAQGPGSAGGGLFFWFYSKLSQAPVTLFIGQQFCWIHDAAGLSWGTTIVGASVTLRLGLMLQAHVTSQKVAAKRRLLYEELDKNFIPTLKAVIAEKVRLEGWSQEKARRKFLEAQSQVVKSNVVANNCALSKLYMPFFVQIPFWICASVSLRNLCSMRGAAAQPEAMERYAQLAREGFGWVPDLTVPDSTWAIPVLVGVAFLASNEINVHRYSRDFYGQGQKAPEAASKVDATSKDKKVAGLSNLSKAIVNQVPNAFRFLALLMIPVSASVPAAVSLYWAASGCSGVAVNLIVNSPKFRRLVRIPKLPEESQHPYRDIVRNMKSSYAQSWPTFRKTS